MSKKRGTKKRRKKSGGGGSSGSARGMMMGMRGGFRKAVGAGPKKRKASTARTVEWVVTGVLVIVVAVLVLRRFGVIHF